MKKHSSLSLSYNDIFSVRTYDSPFSHRHRTRNGWGFEFLHNIYTFDYRSAIKCLCTYSARESRIKQWHRNSMKYSPTGFCRLHSQSQVPSGLERLSREYEWPQKGWWWWWRHSLDISSLPLPSISACPFTSFCTNQP
jgi:hypothetical protein